MDNSIITGDFIDISDLLGRSVMTLAPQAMSAGVNRVITIDAGNLSSGVYLCRLHVKGQNRSYVKSFKMTLIK